MVMTDDRQPMPTAAAAVPVESQVDESHAPHEVTEPFSRDDQASDPRTSSRDALPRSERTLSAPVLTTPVSRSPPQDSPSKSIPPLSPSIHSSSSLVQDPLYDTLVLAWVRGELRTRGLYRQIECNASAAQTSELTAWNVDTLHALWPSLHRFLVLPEASLIECGRKDSSCKRARSASESDAWRDLYVRHGSCSGRSALSYYTDVLHALALVGTEVLHAWEAAGIQPAERGGDESSYMCPELSQAIDAYFGGDVVRSVRARGHQFEDVSLCVSQRQGQVVVTSSCKAISETPFTSITASSSSFNPTTTANSPSSSDYISISTATPMSPFDVCAAVGVNASLTFEPAKPETRHYVTISVLSLSLLLCVGYCALQRVRTLGWRGHTRVDEALPSGSCITKRFPARQPLF